MPRVFRTVEARQDYADIWDFIAAENPPAADRLLRQFDDKLTMIARMPGVGKSRDDLSPGLRGLPVGRYLLFYRPVPEGIQLIRVLHGARDLKSIFRSPG